MNVMSVCHCCYLFMLMIILGVHSFVQFSYMHTHVQINSRSRLHTHMQTLMQNNCSNADNNQKQEKKRHETKRSNNKSQQHYQALYTYIVFTMATTIINATGAIRKNNKRKHYHRMILINKLLGLPTSTFKL